MNYAFAKLVVAWLLLQKNDNLSGNAVDDWKCVRHFYLSYLHSLLDNHIHDSEHLIRYSVL